MDGFIMLGYVYEDIDMFGSLTPANDMLPLLNAHSVILIHGGVERLQKSHIFEQAAEVKDLYGHFRRQLVLSLSGCS